MPNPLSSRSSGALALTMLVITSALTGPQEVRARGNLPEPSSGAPPTQMAQPTGRDAISAQGFWDKPEEDQITALSAASPKFKASKPDAQRATLQSLHEIVGSADEYVRRKLPFEILAAPEFNKLREPAQLEVMRRLDPRFAALAEDQQRLVLSKSRQKFNVGRPRGILLAEVLVGAVVLGLMLLDLLRRRRRSKKRWRGSEQAAAPQVPRPSNTLRSADRLQAVILWLAASVILLEAMCPVTVLLVWHQGGYWKQVPSQTVAGLAKDECCPWASAIGRRKLIIALEQWEDTHADLDFKEWPDFRRMAAETAMSVLIGGGLAYVIRPRRPRGRDQWNADQAESSGGWRM